MPETIDSTPVSSRVAPAHIVRSDAEALRAAKALAKKVDQHAAERDAERQLPWDLLAEFSAQGLSAITVPSAYGGADVSIETLVQAIVELADADPAFAQIPQNHFAILERLRLYGSTAQKDFFYPRFLAGDRLGNATAEPGDKRPNEHRTSLRRDGAGFRITGRKVYATGALYAQWVPVSAVDEAGKGWVLYAPRHSEGLRVIDNWDSFGQRTTASGEVEFNDVYVDAISAFPSVAQTAAKPDTVNHVSQLIHVAIDLGIARRAIRDTIDLLRNGVNPARGSGLEHATQDPLSLRDIGQLKLHYHAAEALTLKAVKLVDAVRPSQDQVGIEQALLAVVDAKILSTEIALSASTKLFELAGTHSTARSLNLDRHWRNARTHTLHDGVRWKYVTLGQYYLNQQAPDAWSMGAPYRPRVAPTVDGE